MRPILIVAVLASGCWAFGQNPAPRASQSTDQQQNANSATKDNSGVSGDQVTKPAGSKGTTLIGCMGGPDANGNYVLTSMQHRAGIILLGPDDLKNATGEKVKLTGSWPPVAADQASSEKQTTKGAQRHFQVTNVEVLSENCQAPSLTTPSNKKK
jgi:hypothetical protein